MALQKLLITTMADLVKNRDENTGGHIQRTAKYVEMISKKLKSENKFTNILTDQYIKDMADAFIKCRPQIEQFLRGLTVTSERTDEKNIRRTFWSTVQ